MSTLIVLCNFPDHQMARDAATAVIERRLAACANIMDGCTSIFRWNDKVELASEIPVLFKTSLAAYGELEIALRELHPYDMPEIVAWPIEFGAEDYLTWVETETQAKTK